MWLTYDKREDETSTFQIIRFWVAVFAPVAFYFCASEANRITLSVVRQR